nr:Rcs stress response system protein RcsF [Echinimonas agarilytica]
MLLACATTLVGCANNYDVSTNLDKENFTEYFKPSQVQVFESDQIPSGYKNIGSIEGMSCQQAENDVPAATADARTQARIAAANLKANGIVIDVCETEYNTESPQCLTLVTCYARALAVPSQSQP